MALPPGRPNILTDPGTIFWAPLGTALPANTVAGGVFTDAWPVAWVQLGMTTSGADFTTNTTINPIDLAESLDPIAYRTTTRSNMISFQLASITAANMVKTLNGAPTTVTGTGATLLTQVSPVQLGQEVRCQVGWESLDASVRIVAYQVVNSGAVSLKFNKAPAHTDLPWTGMLEIPASNNKPYDLFFAGTGRS